MRLIFSNFKQGEVKIEILDLDDLWYLNSIVEEGDIVQGSTTRKIKIGGGEERNTTVVRKKVFLSLQVTQVEFQAYANVLRILGTVLQGIDDVPKGSYHTFAVEPHTTLTIIKKEWLLFHKEKLSQAIQQKTPEILICVLDRDIAYIALLKATGYDLLVTLKGDVPNKREVKAHAENFYEMVYKALKEYEQRWGIKKIVLASVAFWKEEFVKEIKDPEFKKKLLLATCSSGDETALQEVLKRPEVQTALQQERIARESRYVEEILTAIAKEDGLAAYGIKEVQHAVQSGAVRILLVTDQYLQTTRQEHTYRSLESLMKLVEQTKGEVHLIGTDHEAGRKLEGLGGIGALLRYKMYG